MKKVITAFILIIMLSIFSAFLIETEKTKEVLKIYTPTKLGIDFDKNKIIDNNEIICIDSIETFSLEPAEEFYKNYSKALNLNKTDFISLGYLAQDYAEKTLLNKRVKVKLTAKTTKECRHGDILLDGINYNSLLNNSGYGISNNKISNEIKFKQNLKTAQKLNLVLLNHHSNKYHKLDCKFGKLAHDTVLIPQQQLPKGAIPCKYCHNFQLKKEKAFKYKKDFDITEIPNIKQPVIGVTDGNIRLYYTDFTKHLKPANTCETNVCKEFIKLTDNANKSIDLAIYGYDEVSAVTKALQRAKDRGVKIRFIYDENSDGKAGYYQNNDTLKKLSNEHRSDKTDSITQSNMLMHNKFVIFDNKIVYTGSMNFAKSGLSGYNENNVIILNSEEIAKLYTAEFEQMLNGNFHNQKSRRGTINRFKTGNSTIEVYFSPQDKSSARIVQLIQNAKKSIYIPTFLITHTKISNELIKAHSRGVDIKIIMDANNVYTRNTKHAILRQHGIPLKVENYAGKLHSKTMIFDEEYIVTGSMNFSNSGENKNDENMLVINNSKLAREYKKFFLYLWAKIPDKYLRYNPKAESLESIGSCSDGIDNNFNGKIDKEEELCR